MGQPRSKAAMIGQTSYERGTMLILFMTLFGISGAHTLPVDKESKTGSLDLFPVGFQTNKWEMRWY